MNRTLKFINNTLAAGVYQCILMISGFVIPKIILTYYGSEINGLVSSVTQFVNYIMLVEAGLSGAAVFALYKPLADEDHAAISGIVVATKKFYNTSGWIFVVLVVALSCLYPWVIKLNFLASWDVFLLVLIIGINGCFEFFTLGKYRALLTADQKQHVISLSSTLYCVLNVAIIAIMAGLGCGIVAARLIAVAAIVVRSVVLSAYCRKHYGYINYREEPNYGALSKRWDALFLQILGTVHSGVPIVFATALTSMQEVSVYSVFNLVTNGIASVLGIFTNGVGAGFGDLIARKDEQALKRAYSDFEFLYYWLIAFVYSVTIVQIMPFVRLYTKGIYDADYERPLLSLLFVLNGFLFNLKTPQGMMVISGGLYKETRNQTITQAMIAIVCSGILGRFYGLVGIMVGMCISNIYRDIDLVVFIPKMFPVLSKSESTKNIVLSLVGVLVTMAIGQRLNMRSDSVIWWILSSLIMCAVAGIVLVLLAFIFRRKMLYRCMDRVKGLLNRS